MKINHSKELTTIHFLNYALLLTKGVVSYTENEIFKFKVFNYTLILF